MTTDTLSRRLRFAPPNPQVKRLVLQDADLLLFQAINRHGPLPMNYLYALTKHVRKDKTNLQHRLTEFYNGDEDGPYLTRPPQQFSAFKARYQYLVYDLAPRGRKVLEQAGTPPSSRDRKDPFLHQLMQACVGASLELAAQKHGLRYIPRDEVLSGRPLALALDDRTKLVPDDLFCLEGTDDKGPWRRWCALEIDRNTESIERKATGYNTFGKKVDNYLRVLRGRLFEAWGIKNLTVLTVTTNATHAVNMLDHVGKQNDPKFGARFAFSVVPQFGFMWEVPGTVLFHLMDEPWQSLAGPKDITKA